MDSNQMNPHNKRRLATAAMVSALMLANASCGGSGGESAPTVATLPNTPTTSVSPAASAADSAVSSGQAASAPAASTTPTAASAPAAAGIVNKWVGPPVDQTALPIGTSLVSLDGPSVGHLYACDAGRPDGRGAHVAGPWLDEAAGTWDLTQKASVQGEVSWPMATYSEVVEGEQRVITSNGLPVDMVTGTFPIASDDPAYAFDRNPNHIEAIDVSLSVPINPVAAAAPTCLGKGPIGVLKNGVSMFASLDESNRDAAAYETQDQCDGHPQQQSMYHYHTIPSCILAAATGASTVVGYANDGFPIVVERDESGDLPTNADLDVCHGRMSPIELDGSVVETYHYSATHEFPYFVGCFTGTPVL